MWRLLHVALSGIISLVVPRVLVLGFLKLVGLVVYPTARCKASGGCTEQIERDQRLTDNGQEEQNIVRGVIARSFGWYCALVNLSSVWLDRVAEEERCMALLGCITTYTWRMNLGVHRALLQSSKRVVGVAPAWWVCPAERPKMTVSVAFPVSVSRMPLPGPALLPDVSVPLAHVCR